MENMLMVIQQLLQLHPKPEPLSRVAGSAWPDMTSLTKTLALVGRM